MAAGILTDRTSNQGLRSEPWLSGVTEPLPDEAVLRLFCLPHAGGGASAFLPWRTGLPGIQVCPIQLPGREGRWAEQSYSSSTKLVRDLSVALQPLLGVPFAIFGHSMGAFIAFELAHQICADSQRIPIRLIVAGARAPHLPQTHPAISGLPDEEFLKCVCEFNGISPEIQDNQELMQLILPTLRSDIALGERYEFRHREKLTCPISVYGGDCDKSVSPKCLAAWESHTSGTFSLQMFSGDHFFMTYSRKLLLRSIAEDLFDSKSDLQGYTFG